jgi:hypothetical protein
MRTLVARPQSERSATANIRIVFTMDAHFASELRGSDAFISRKPRSDLATIRPDRAVCPRPKCARAAL